MNSVPDMFNQISSSYDRLNTILSFGMDKSWRRRMSVHLPNRDNLDLLDLASGTGEQLIALFNTRSSIRSAIGIDLASHMLKIAQEKIQSKPYKDKIKLQKGDCLRLPFPSNSFDAVSFSFGIRNVNDPIAALKEIYRVLRPSGRCLILEFSLPPPPIKTFHLFYLRYIVPYLGAYFAKNKSAYRYLNETIEKFPYGNAFCHLMKSSSLASIRQFPMALGAVTLYTGDKK
ncbi:MAG TPA: bifunctional demethylmenaquinone methyltransferase/2-methoxy-6-polyprenyl-1,4-benzoquinol methylase UbiE [Chlamydiales bacterium]|nr:bifunctional demethylmenaquinone methyltransferase/2-methoxy-6-polyprenyl-1,4-benzoquinol methylase UbiE [Chlamydiales bacterium]